MKQGGLCESHCCRPRCRCHCCRTRTPTPSNPNSNLSMEWDGRAAQRPCYRHGRADWNTSTLPLHAGNPTGRLLWSCNLVLVCFTCQSNDNRCSGDQRGVVLTKHPCVIGQAASDFKAFFFKATALFLPTANRANHGLRHFACFVVCISSCRGSVL